MKILQKQLVVAVAIACVFYLGGCKTTNQASYSKDSSEGPASRYLGHTWYKLLFSQPTGIHFDPNQDVLVPSKRELAFQKVLRPFQSSAVTSLMPLLGKFMGGQMTADESLFEAASSMALSSMNGISDKLEQSIQTIDPSYFPYVSESHIVPWLEYEKDNIYSKNKITLSSARSLAIFGQSPGGELWDKRLTKSIKELQKKFYKKTDGAAFLLSSRSFLFVQPGRSRLTIRILLGLNPLESPFKQENKKVKFSKVVVPPLGETGVVAKLLFDIDLSEKTDPILHVDFGEFDRVESGKYILSKSAKFKKALRLEGQVAKRGAGFVGLNFTFQKMSFNLRQGQLNSLNTLVAPGFRIAGSNWTAFGIHAESVDTQFKNEINATIDKEIKNGLAGANESMLGGVLSPELTSQIFNQIFTR